MDVSDGRAADGGPATPQPASPRKRDAKATREALLAAARACFTASGFDGTSTREIANAAGVNQALVYRYFGSKELLFQESVDPGPPVGALLDAGVTVRELPRELLEFLLGGHLADMRKGAPLQSFFASLGHDVMRDRLREKIAEEFTGRVGERLDGPHAPLRAELMAALLVGTGILREFVETPALSSARIEDVVDLVDMLAQRLIDAEPAPGPTSAG